MTSAADPVTPTSPRTMYTRYCWPPVKVVTPETSNLTAELFHVLDSRVCELYRVYTNNYQTWKNLVSDCCRGDLVPEEALLLDVFLRRLETALTKQHVDLEWLVTFYEVQTSILGNDFRGQRLSSWQTRNQRALTIHIDNLTANLRTTTDPSLRTAMTQKIAELRDRESTVITETLVPRLPHDSPGNDVLNLARLLSASTHNPTKQDFIKRKMAALCKTGKKRQASRRSCGQKPS